ncbi:MAG: hypothetical protein U0163_19610 [Gemmatimonadaceae bacterium]
MIDTLLRGGAVSCGARVFVTGEAGVGKSRLIAELLQGRRVVRWQL